MNRLSHHTATPARTMIYADADADADDIVVAANDGTSNDGTPNDVSGLRPPRVRGGGSNAAAAAVLIVQANC